MRSDRITVEPGKLGGRPCIRGLRISVETIVRLVAAGWSFDEILQDYPQLEREDITAALEYAAESMNVHIPEDLAEVAEAGAWVQGTSVNRLVVEALRAEIDRVRADKSFIEHARQLLERDDELLERLESRDPGGPSGP
jgi:uncharacterized protein (DUF433 family)